jgi:tyrosine-protein kinase Etk/Wzc
LQKSQNIYQINLLDLVEKSVKNYNGREEIVANANGLTDPVFTAQITAYNTLVEQKQSIFTTGTQNDVRLPSINDQLAQARNNILKNVGNIRKQFTANASFLNTHSGKFSNKFAGLPEKEKQYIELNRKLTVQENLYTFLLQKKEDTQLQFVSADVVRSRTVDDVLTKGLVEPVALFVYAKYIAIGVFTPCFIIFLTIFFNSKISTKKEVEDGTTAPILGELSLSPLLDTPVAITVKNRSALAEQFRAIRTNLSYISTNVQQVFVVTSSISGEGKSFVSLNMANSLAIMDKKVVLLELDLRKPMLSKKLGVTRDVGISQYLINDKMKPEEIIFELTEYPNLSLINSGPIPPNPGELITRDRMAELISYLRENFDYVIMDTPPVGLVADAISLGQLADTSIFVIRHNYSYRSALQLLNDLKKNNKLPNLSLIINGIETQKGYGYGYGYGGYGYGGYGYGGYVYGFYSDDHDKKNNTFKSLLDSIKKRFK